MYLKGVTKIFTYIMRIQSLEINSSICQYYYYFNEERKYMH